MSTMAFEQIAQEILKMKQRMEKTEAENADLRRQIHELREGRGIFIDILDRRFALTVETSPEPSINEANENPTEIVLPAANEADIPEMPTTAFAELPAPEIEMDEEPQLDQAEENEPAVASTFLEEILMDEFAEAATNASAIWSEPVTMKQPAVKNSDEEQKAALRKALVGSFLLE